MGTETKDYWLGYIEALDTHISHPRLRIVNDHGVVVKEIPERKEIKGQQLN